MAAICMIAVTSLCLFPHWNGAAIVAALLCCSKKVNINGDVKTLIDQSSFTELALLAASPLAQNFCASRQRSVGYFSEIQLSSRTTQVQPCRFCSQSDAAESLLVGTKSRQIFFVQYFSVIYCFI